MYKWIMMFAAGIFLVGCSEKDDPGTGSDNDADEKLSQQKQESLNQMKSSFQEVQKHYNALGDLCSGGEEVNPNQHQEVDQQFHKAVSSFKGHHKEYHHPGHDDDREGHEDDHESDYENEKEGHHENEGHDDDHNGEAHHQEGHHGDDDDDDDESEDDDHEQEERELHDQVEQMVQDHCHYDQ